VRSILVILLSIWVSGIAIAAEGIQLYPVKGLFIPAATQGGGRIDQDFTTSVDRATAGQYFDAEFRKVFTNATSAIDDKNKRRTYIVSLQVIRASRYEVPKPDGTVDEYIPVTGSLYFTNALTGEILYSVTSTNYLVKSIRGVTGSIDGSKYIPLYAESFHALVGDLITKAKTQFNPSSIDTNIKRDWNGLFVLDAGQTKGISKDDSLTDATGNELRVLYSTPSYSVARIELGKARMGSVFTKETNRKLSEVKKPKVMVIVGKSTADYPAETLRQVFSDAVGEKAAISIIPVNEMFASVLSTVFSGDKLSQDDSRKRELPDLILTLNVPDVIDIEIPTTEKQKIRRIYQSLAFGTLTDKSGRVLYSDVGADRIEDEVVAGIGFDVSARREIALKNALVDLADKFASAVKFKQTVLPIAVSGQTITVKDAGGSLVTGSSYVAFKNLGKVEGIGDEVKVPLWEVNAIDSTGEHVVVTPDLAFVSKAQLLGTGDTIILDEVEQSKSPGKRRFVECEAIEQLGSLSVKSFGDLAINNFSHSFTAPFFQKGLSGSITSLVSSESGFKTSMKFREPGSDYCVQPVSRIDVTEVKCSSEKMCAQHATVRMTYRVKKGTEVVVKNGLESKLTSTSFFEGTSTEAQRKLIEIDLLKELLKLSAGIVVRLEKETFK